MVLIWFVFVFFILVIVMLSLWFFLLVDMDFKMEELMFNLFFYSLEDKFNENWLFLIGENVLNLLKIFDYNKGRNFDYLV